MTFTLNEESVTEAFATDERLMAKCKEISADLINRKYDISSFVESLGFALTSPKVELRVNGTKLLSGTLETLPVDYLTSAQLEFIVAFYCDRLKDHHNVLPAVIDGITSFVAMTNLPAGSITKLLTNFFQHVSCQSQVRDDREKIFSIIKTISESHIVELTAMGPTYVYGVINSIDGERDPRNLHFLFDFMPSFIKQFPLHHLAEEMFETFACYFPIDFQPVKTDPKSISRETLADKLANCLVASQEFSEWVFALLLEKMESELVVAKLDSLELLSRSAQKFDPAKIELLFDDIWTHLKSEIFPGSGNDEIVSAGLNALKILLQRAASQPDISKNFQTKVLSNILPYVSNANHRLFGPSMLIAVACVSGDSLFSSEKILNAIAIRLKEDECSTEQKAKLFTALPEILRICMLEDAFSQMNCTVLGQLKAEVLDSLKFDSSSAELTRLGLKNVEIFWSILSESERTVVYDCLVKIATLENVRFDLSTIVLKCGRTNPDELSANFVDILSSNFAKYSLQTKHNVYSDLVVLAAMPRFEQKIMNLLMTNVFESQNDAEEQELGLSALKELLESNSDTELVKRLWTNYKILENVKKLVRNSPNISSDRLAQIATVISLFVRRLSIADQQFVLDQYLPQTQTIAAQDVFILKGILGHMHESVSMDAQFDGVFENLMKLCLETDDETIRRVGYTLLCSLANKAADTGPNDSTIKRCLNQLRQEIKKDSKRAVEILAWIGKGLIVRGHAEAGEIIEDIAKLLDHPSLYATAELAFDIISVEVPELHLPVAKWLFKQKFFHTVLKKLWNKLIGFEENHVNAFAHVLGMTPHPVLKMYLEKIDPILFKCTESNKIKTIKISLDIIKLFLQEQNDYFRTHLNHLIPQFIVLSTRQDSMDIRISALECLEIISKYPIHVLQPYKIDVVLGLAAVLDDRKRLVRNAAVKTRNAWFLLGSDNN